MVRVDRACKGYEAAAMTSKLGVPPGSTAWLDGNGMSHRKWRETKQQLISWPNLALLGCCFLFCSTFHIFLLLPLYLTDTGAERGCPENIIMPGCAQISPNGAARRGMRLTLTARIKAATTSSVKESPKGPKLSNKQDRTHPGPPRGSKVFPNGSNLPKSRKVRLFASKIT